MNRRLFLLGLAVLPAIGMPADRHEKRKTCDRINRNIRDVEKKLRAGYTAKQGRRYRQRMRELQEDYLRACR